jgi:hypothetical protein
MFGSKRQVHEDMAGISLSENEAMEDVNASEGSVVLDLFLRFASSRLRVMLTRSQITFIAVLLPRVATPKMLAR